MSDPFSPAASIKSGTATIPNTPCSDDDNCISDLRSDEQIIGSNVEATICATPSPINLSRQQDHDIPSTWPCDISHKKIQASASWSPNQNLDGIFLDIHWSKKHSRAILKLHTSISLESGRVRAFIFLKPENIRQLSFNAQPERERYGYSTISLTLKLYEHPGLILPKTHIDVEQREHDKMRSLTSLAQQSDFTIDASLSKRELSQNWWEQFSQDIAAQKFKSIENVANVMNLYEGNGGREIRDGMLEDLINKFGAPGLPAYQETDPGIPDMRPRETDPRIPDTRPPKRKRPYNDSSTIAQTDQPTDTVTMEAKKRKPCDESLTTGQTAQSTDSTAMEAIIRIIVAKLADHKLEVGAMVQDMLIAHKREVQGMLTAHKCEVAEKFESMEAGLPHMMEEVMEKKGGELVEFVMEQIASMPLQAHFTFPAHPYL